MLRGPKPDPRPSRSPREGEVGLDAVLATAPREVQDKLRLQVEIFSEFAKHMALSADGETGMVARHVREALWSAPHFRGPHLLDIGSGGGYPAVAVAILRPDLDVTLCERRRKTAAFLDLLLAKLGLRRVRVAMSDARDLLPPEPRWSSISARAIPTPEKWIRRAAGSLALPGRLLFFSTAARAGLLEAPCRQEGLSVSILPDPGSDQRVLVIGERKQP